MPVDFKGVRWKEYNGALLPDVPANTEIELSKAELRRLAGKTGASFIRWTSGWDRGEETSFWYVIKDSFGGMDELSSKMRNQVRKGYKNNTVEKIDGDRLKREGYPVFGKAFSRYENTGNPFSEDEFRTWIDELNGSGEYHFWAVYDREENKMAGFACNRIRGGECGYSSLKLDPAYMKNYASYALIYEMNKYYLEDNGYDYINDGARSILHDTNFQDFLLDKFNFRKAYCRLHVHYKFPAGAAVAALYPFRALFRRTGKLKAVLNQEEMRRNG
jgi:hypothetical protein